MLNDGCDLVALPTGKGTPCSKLVGGDVRSISKTMTIVVTKYVTVTVEMRGKGKHFPYDLEVVL